MKQTPSKEIGAMSETQDDKARHLLRRVAEGDREALTDLYARYSDMLFRYLLRLTPDRALAEDLLQDTFVAIWRSAGSFAGRSSAQTWLIGVAHRQAHNTLRRRKLNVADTADLALLAAPDADPENAALAKASRDELLAAIARLSLVHREALALSFGQGLAAQEIATALDIPLGTVKSRLRDAKRALRGILTAGKAGY